MNGWLIIFAATSTTSGIVASFVRAPEALFAAALFGVLFVLTVCARAVRGSVC